MAQPLLKPKKIFTYADYLTWPDDERWEIIDGEAFDMTPAPGLTHQEVSQALERQIDRFLEGHTCRMFHAQFDVMLPDEKKDTDDQIKTVVQPDIFVVCDTKKITERGLRGAPDWIIEILSPSTAGRDHIRKLRLYERHKVKEYWLVHPTDRTVTIYRLLGKSYSASEIFDEANVIPVKVLPGLEIDFSKVFPPQTKIVRESPRKYLAKKKKCLLNKTRENKVEAASSRLKPTRQGAASTFTPNS